MDTTSKYVVSMNGITKKICCSTCVATTCSRAHPNAAGSKVLHPKWCLRGCISTCDSIICPFNHFRSEGEFIAYRAGDSDYVQQNPAICSRYQSQIDRANERREKKERQSRRKIFIGDFISD